MREGELPNLDDGRRSYLIRRALDKFIADSLTACAVMQLHEGYFESGSGRRRYPRRTIETS